jgi:hypothetical protein
LRAPLLDLPGPSYAELFARSAFAQRPLLDSGALAEAARQRGISIAVHPQATMVRLDTLGAFCPIAFCQTNYTVETTWLDPDPECMVWREERDFQPWETYAWRSQSGLPYVSEKYSAWQLLYLADALEHDSVAVPVNALLAADGLDSFVRAAAQRRSAQRKLDEEWRPLVKLLVALQARLWPFRVGKTTLLTDPEGDPNAGYVDPVEIEVERFSATTILRQFGLDLNRLAELHAELAYAAARLDPAPNWYRLVEIAPRTRTDQLRGAALRTRDLHDACFLLRGLYFLATDKWLPRPDELDDPAVPVRDSFLPRSDGKPGADREELQAMLEREGLYPHRVHFVVEGDTEEIVLRRLLGALGRQSGYQVTNLRGVDQAEQHRALFSAASEYASRTVLIADV